VADLSPTSGTTTTQFLWDGGNGAYSDTRYRTVSGLWDKAPQLAALDPSVAYTLFDDFFNYDPTNAIGDWQLATDAGGTQALLDEVGGVLSIGSDGDDNDASVLHSVTECFKVVAGKPIWFEARVRCTEAATDDANLIVGLSDLVTVDAILDTGAGPAASYDGVVFYKVDGGTVWGFETSNAGTQATTANAGAFVTATWYRLGFHIDPNDGTTAIVTPYIDGVAGTPLNLTIAGMEEMHVLIGVKSGGGNEEAIVVDYVKVVQLR
jgi:hypothetical protein